MPSFNQLAAGFLNATNENNAALVSTKFDFSLIKLEAPVEFAAVGPTLSTQRRIDAEIGTIHRTARRLAALFEQIIPSTPKLIAAYGNRVSSIASNSKVNPKGSANESFLAPFVGLNGTAVWAAATSGIPAIGVYLLACLLARAWDAKRAVAIWVELVEARKTEIRTAFEASSNVPEATLLSTLQQITRDELAQWDDSARSWISSADQVMQWHLKQLELVTKDTALSFVRGGTTYERVSSTWKQAMNGIESLLSGSSQQISDASILLAFSAWHLFPDLIVLANGATKIPFRDSLFPQCAIGTIGLFSADDSESDGIQWSLTLSHLHYYGPPVDVQSEASQPRITFPQLRMAALGALFYKWKIHRREYEATARFISGLWEILSEATGISIKPDIKRCFGWLHVFVKASNDYLAAKARSKVAAQECSRLISFGYRRGWDFIGPADQNLKPLFGLQRKEILDALRATNDSDCGIEYMQSIARSSSMTSDEAFILKSHWHPTDIMYSQANFYEIVAVASHPITTGKRDAQGNYIIQSVRGRWFLTDPNKSDEISAQIQERELQHNTEDEFSSVIPDGTRIGKQYHSSALRSAITWQAPKLFSRTPHCFGVDETSRSLGLPCKCFEAGEATEFEPIFGDWRCGLFSTRNRRVVRSNTLLGSDATLEMIRNVCNRDTLWSYLASLSRVSNVSRPSNIGVDEVARSAAFSPEVSKALHALAVADIIFENISSPTISQTCIGASLHDLEWIPGNVLGSIADVLEGMDSGTPNYGEIDLYNRFHSQVPKMPSRAQSFACIAFFDSGHLNINPVDLEHVLAMNSGNSIYVTGKALSDPATKSPAYDIRHVIGSIGEKGISMLVAPIDPRIRKLGSDYRLVNHAPYDHRREDNFKDTTLHLSFTKWTQPLMSANTERTIDSDVYFVESVISVRDRGEWVADLDILGIEYDRITRLKPRFDCGGSHIQQPELCTDIEYTSIDSWEEFLDHPVSTGIFRAHGNWAARLAATSILFQRGFDHCVGVLPQSQFCLHCMEKDQADNNIREDHESFLPSFCLD